MKTFSCAEAQQWLVDETQARPPLLSEHVGGCERCGPFSKSLALAHQLRGVEPLLSRKVPVARAQKRLQLGAALALVLVGGVFEARVVQGKLASRVAGSNVDQQEAAWRAMALLQHGAANEARLSPTEIDPSLRGFGQLGGWIAPSRAQPLRSLGLTVATDTRLIHTRED